MSTLVDLAQLPLGKHRLPCPNCSKGPRDRTMGVLVEPGGRWVSHCFRCALIDHSAAEHDVHRTQQERDRLQRELQRARQREQVATFRRQADAAAFAIRRWVHAPPAVAHPYLTAKHVKPFGLRIEGHLLLVPVRDFDGHLLSLQTIAANGTKRFLAGGRKEGGYHQIGRIRGRVAIAEGYATAATFHMETGMATVCAFDAGNLPAVAKALRERLPETHIVIAGDDDKAGRAAAHKAAHIADAEATFPDFAGLPRGPGDTDFNDLAALRRRETQRHESCR